MARWVQFNERFGKLVLDALDGDDADGFYVFNGAGLEILAHCRQRGLRAVLDQTIAPLSYERKLLQEEREPWPEWFFSPEGPGEAADELTRREKTEWQLADTVVCGSEFVRRAVGLEGGPHYKCAVVPYVMARLKTGLNTPGRDVNGPLRVLFAGTVTPRKGIQYLLSAARELAGKGFEFRAVGPIAIPEAPLRQLRRFVDVVGPVPRSAMRAQYIWSDVLVHPTLCEGSANVCYEALANGVPVVTTPNAGSVVRDGLDGFIVPIRDPDAIAVKLEMLRRHQQLRVQMSRSAVDRASKFTWDNYAGRLLSVLVGGGTSAGDP
jgi:glycosyltransferase involved in cell wall biosynthesis